MKLTGKSELYNRFLRARWRLIKLKLLKFFLYFVPNEKQRVLFLTLIIGGVCGVVAVVFHMSIIKFESVLLTIGQQFSGSYFALLVVLFPAVGGVISGLLLKYGFPEARGSGIPQVKVAYAVKDGRLPFRDAVGKFMISVIQIGSGASLGREGPTVQICATLSTTLGRLFAVSSKNIKKLVPVGTAAGIAAAFNAPIAAVTFTIEEIVGDLDQTVLSGIIIAAAIAAVVERSILGTHPVLAVPQTYGLYDTTSIVLYVALGIAAAVASLVFTESLLKLRSWFRRLNRIPIWIRPGIGGLITGILILIAYSGMHTFGIAGSGYETLSSALSGKLVLQTLLVLFVFKIIATVFCYGSGGAGGIVAPALFIGGMLGGTIGTVEVQFLGYPASEIGAFALVGMGAVFAGIIRAPITSVLIIFEMTGSYGLILPLMIANMTSFSIARRFRPVPIYDALLEQDGIYLPDAAQKKKHALEFLRVRDAYNDRIKSLNSDLTVVESLKQVQKYNFTVFPVLDSGSHCVGLINEIRLRRSLAENAGDRRIAELLDKFVSITPGEYLSDAVAKMNEAHVRMLAVVSGTNGRFEGLLTMTDVVGAESKAILEQKGLESSSIADIHRTAFND